VFENPVDATPLDRSVRAMLVVWCLLLIPWAFFALMSGMFFDAGYTVEAYLAFLGIWTYPILLGIAFFYRKKRPILLWLPALNFAVLGLSSWVGDVARNFPK
jgi:predicted permease